MFSEEYRGRDGYTRHFVASTYLVRGGGDEYRGRDGYTRHQQQQQQQQLPSLLAAIAISSSSIFYGLSCVMYCSPAPPPPPRKSMWRKHQSTEVQRRHLYEVIRADRPCHAYLDLEYRWGGGMRASGRSAIPHLLDMEYRCLCGVGGWRECT